MGSCAVLGALMQCSFGAAPSSLIVAPTTRTMIEGRPAATITDFAPMANIPPFGMCLSLANPMVAAATSAALGVLTPQPCVPATVGPWQPGSPKTIVAGRPALVSGSTCQCAWGGVISLTAPGAMRTTAN